MDLILSNNTLGLGGSESYLLTLAESLDRLGHRVTVHAHEPGAMAPAARRMGLEVVDDAGLPAGCDAVVVQDAAVAFDLANRYPRAPQLFVAHSTIFDLQSPPQLPGIVGAVVALHDRVAERMGALAAELPVTRLRQPIDVQRFVPGRPLRDPPWRALVLSNRLGRRRATLEQACRAARIELTEVGAATGPALDPRGALMDADIVIGYGRSILEAMACGRAAYVYDDRGGDGWVTAESYGALEANGFAGAAGLGPVSPERLADDLRAYDPAMGLVTRDLITTHHRAEPHACAIVELLAGLEVARRPPAPLEEMARLVRLQWRAHDGAWASESRNAAAMDSNERLLAENARLATENAGLRARLERRGRRIPEALGRSIDAVRRRGSRRRERDQ